MKRTARVSGTTNGSKPGLMTVRPSTAESDRHGRRDHRIAEEEGSTDDAKDKHEAALRFRTVSTSTTRERMPPSPLLSARISRKTYLIVTMRISAQISKRDDAEHASRRSPPASHHVGESFAHRVERAVPMSPKTTPMRGERQLELVDGVRARASSPAGLRCGSCDRPCFGRQARFRQPRSTAPSQRRGIQQEGPQCQGLGRLGRLGVRGRASAAARAASPNQ